MQFRVVLQKKLCKQLEKKYADEELIVAIPGQFIKQVAEDLPKLGSVKERIRNIAKIG